MAFAFFRMPCDASPAAAAELNQFLRTHRIVTVTRQGMEAGTESCWAFCVEYVETSGGSGTVPGVVPTGTKIDYREILPPEQFAVFSRLRTLRKTISEREGQPVFAVFTNGQLAEMVQRDCRTLEDLRGIAGIGEARAGKYGAEVLAVMKEGGA